MPQQSLCISVDVWSRFDSPLPFHLWLKLCYGHCCDFVSLALVWYSHSNIASRYNKFLDMISACRGVLMPAKLPPTERAAIYQSLCAHLQIIEWRNIGDVGFHLTATNWGWELREGKLTPFMTNIEVAPDSLLKFVRCYCKVVSKSTCGTNKCTCVRNSIRCVASCGNCHGQDCSNGQVRNILVRNSWYTYTTLRHIQLGKSHRRNHIFRYFIFYFIFLWLHSHLYNTSVWWKVCSF